MTIEEFFNRAEPLSPEDQRLVDANIPTRRALDDLVYTPEFEKLVRSLHGDASMKNVQDDFRSLLALRKMGRLPRLADGVAYQLKKGVP